MAASSTWGNASVLVLMAGMPTLVASARRSSSSGGMLARSPITTPIPAVLDIMHMHACLCGEHHLYAVCSVMHMHACLCSEHRLYAVRSEHSLYAVCGENRLCALLWPSLPSATPGSLHLLRILEAVRHAGHRED